MDSKIMKCHFNNFQNIALHYLTMGRNYMYKNISQIVSIILDVKIPS